MLQKIKNFLYNRELKKLYYANEAERRKKMISFNRAKNILILFDATEEHESTIIFDIVDSIKKQGKIVRVVGYVNYNEPPHYCFPKISHDYLTLKTKKFNEIPKSNFVADVIKEFYDIMIDFTYNYNKQLFYIAALANATLKISRKKDDIEFPEDIYDIKIISKSSNQYEFFEECVEYLEALQGKK